MILWTGNGWTQDGSRVTTVERCDFSSRYPWPRACGKFNTLEWGNVDGYALVRKRTTLAMQILTPCVGESQAIRLADDFGEQVLAELPAAGWSIWNWQVLAWVVEFQRSQCDGK